jgi:SSS family solute:Na+ symporter
MRWLDWVVVVVYLVWVIGSGLRQSRRTNEVEGYFRANRSLPWWAVGLSVMATQLSAITLVGTTGQGYADGIRFVQFYFGLPIAMVILSVMLVPFFYRSGVYTAYEFLERRFDVKTRTLAALLFLAQRGLSCGVIIAAPAIILSIVLGWNLVGTILAIGAPTIVYTMVGGVQAVTWTDVRQMCTVVGAMVAAVVVLVVGLPHGVTAGDALRVAGALGKLQAIDFKFDLHEKYTIWSGLIGGLFLSLSYFGCDQSQVQRYLTAKSIDQSRHSLLMSAFVKIPLQALILLTGVFVFTFFLFHRAPMVFNPVHAKAVLASSRAAEYQTLDAEYGAAFEARRVAAQALTAAGQEGTPATVTEGAREGFVRADAQVRDVRARAVALVQAVSGDRTYTDVNYVFPTFILTYMPIGLVGLMIAAILSAAMSASSGEMNALATATVMDVYKRHVRPNAPDATYLLVSKIATGFWGLFACGVAVYAARLGSLIEVVNTFGSLFYGSVLGVFILALGVKPANGHGAFIGLVAGIVVVFTVAFHPATSSISYLWYNVIGAVVVTAVGTVVSVATGGARGRPASVPAPRGRS